MITTSQKKFFQFGAMFSPIFSLSQFKRDCKNKEERIFKLIYADLNYLFTKVDGCDKTIAAEKDVHHITEGFGDEHDAASYKLASDKIMVQELHYSCNVVLILDTWLPSLWLQLKKLQNVWLKSYSLF